MNYVTYSFFFSLLVNKKVCRMLGSKDMVCVSICLDIISELQASYNFVKVKLLSTFVFLVSSSVSFDYLRAAFVVPGGIGILVSVALQVNLFPLFL